MEDIANRPKCPDCGRLKIVGVRGWVHPYPYCDPVTTRLSDSTDRARRCGYVPPENPNPPPGPAAVPKIPCVLPDGHDGQHNHWPFVS